MLILTKSVLALMVGFVFSAFLGLILLPLLRKLKVRQTVSVYLAETHKSKNGTPTMGGLIFILATIITVLMLVIMGKLDFSYNLLIVLFVFVAYAAIGFLDDFLIIKRGKNLGLTEIQKLLLQLFVAVIFFFIYMVGGGDTTLTITTFNINIDLGFMYGFFLLFMMLASSNAVNITDGLDGLAGGLSVIAFLVFGIISWGSGWIVGHQEIAVLCFIIVGAVLGFLVYNSYPAKIFMGDTGSLALGATLASVAILTKHEITLIVVAGVFVIETLTVLIQIASVKLRKKRVFPMTPIHHTFEKMGWHETDIVKLFWVVGFLLGMAGIAFGVWI